MQEDLSAQGGQHKPDEAIVEYREAIRLDPKHAEPHYNFGLALRDQAGSGSAGPERAQRLHDACAEFARGAALAPDDPDYAARMRDIDGLLRNGSHCPPR